MTDGEKHHLVIFPALTDFYRHADAEDHWNDDSRWARLRSPHAGSIGEPAGIHRDALRTWEGSSDAVPGAQYRTLCKLIDVLQREGVRFAENGGCELVAKIVPKEMLISSDRASGDFSDCQSQADIAIRLLNDVGVPDGGATPSMIEAAVEAQLLFVERLEAIAKGN
jgi:hypothetical protein